MADIPGDVAAFAVGIAAACAVIWLQVGLALRKGDLPHPGPWDVIDSLLWPLYAARKCVVCSVVAVWVVLRFLAVDASWFLLRVAVRAGRVVLGRESR